MVIMNGNHPPPPDAIIRQPCTSDRRRDAIVQGSRARQTGFTLVELAIVLVIMGIVAQLALPQIKAMILKQQLRSAASELYITLALARSEAVKRNGDVTIEPVSGTDWTSGWTVTASADGTTYNLDAQDASLLEELTITGELDSTPPASVTYRRNGRIAAGATGLIFEIKTTDIQTMYCVDITLSGKPVVEEDDDSDNTNGCQRVVLQ